MDREVTATEAAKLTGLSERTIRRRILSGALPARHVRSNRYAIRMSDLALSGFPAQDSIVSLIARVQALESRMQHLEHQVAQVLAVQEPSEEAPPARM
ncbi:MAG TPA: helix-turn-helix domain-containing protein [Ktedonobacterales bacterium]